MTDELFPTDQPDLEWREFPAQGFSGPVSGLIYRTGRPPCCGVPLGGISTGCLDIDISGVYGFSSIFNPISPFGRDGSGRMPRKSPNLQPLLGLSVGGQCWVLTTQEIIDGGDIPWCTEPERTPVNGAEEASGTPDTVNLPRLEGVRGAREVHYWGHYPVADMEFETDAPVDVSLRAWAPFIPGDAAASNTPAAVFEVHLRNTDEKSQRGTLAFNFPGPDSQEARAGEFTRELVDEDFRGTVVRSTSGVGYALGIIGRGRLRLGSGLNNSSSAWADIAKQLPQPSFREDQGGRLYQDASSSAAVDFSLEPGEVQTVRFLLAWYAPVWEGARREIVQRPLPEGLAPHGTKEWSGSKWGGDTNFYANMYGARYDGALDVARRMAADHRSLLNRVLAWQSVIYGETGLPVWLRDSLVNNLALIAEVSHWAQAKAPLGDWAYPEGVFGLNESPRSCPQTSCITCDWYGNLPIVYFFPELALSTLNTFKYYQHRNGEVPFSVGCISNLPDFASPRYGWQVSLNGTCYVDMVDRLWQHSGDDAILEEYYPSAKRCTTFTMNLRKGPGGVISMPKAGGMEWFEFGEWAGMCSHMGGMRLAQLRMMERMARHMGDTRYARRCRDWYADGSRAMEEQLWTGSYYLNYLDEETGKKSDDVMGYQLDGQWTVDFHGLPAVFQPDRIKKTLETIERCNVSLTPTVGAANFSRPDGRPLSPDSEVAAYGTYTMFCAELLVLAMTYIYAGEKEFGLDLARRHWENLVCRQRHPWDMPNSVRGDTGQRAVGTDYYQVMMLWALPAALRGEDLREHGLEGGLVDRIIQAGNGR